jgi:cyanophycinase
MKFFLLTTIILWANSNLSAQIFLTGNPQDISPRSNQLICLAGGGDDALWSAGWRQLLTSANGGDVVIIRADGRRGGYEDWIYNDSEKLNFPKVNSVRTLLLNNADDANSKEAINVIQNAELIFFAGGDQSVYIKLLSHSKLLAAIKFMMNSSKISIAGTSAGMALLAGTSYTANFSSPTDKQAMVTSADVLKDPTAQFVDLKKDFLVPPFMRNIITDSHFTERERQGRLVGFMARAVYNNNLLISALDILGIGADEGTAFCYNKNGSGKVYGAGSVYFLKGNTKIEKIEKNSNLIWFGNHQAVKVYQANKDSSFDIKNWSGTSVIEQFWWVNQEKGKETQLHWSLI